MAIITEKDLSAPQLKRDGFKTILVYCVGRPIVIRRPNKRCSRLESLSGRLH
jgi:hypothetical protein